MRRQFLIMAAALLVLAGLLRFTPPAKGQFTAPAIPGTFGDISTPSVPPPAGATRVYTKAGTVCAFSPAAVETCTGSGGSSVTFAAPYVTSGANVFGPSWALTIPPLTSWTQVGSPTFDTTAGYPYVHGANAGSVILRGIYRSAPSTPYSVNIGYVADWSGVQGAGATGTEAEVAFGWTDATKFSVTHIGIGGGAAAFGMRVVHWNNNTTTAAVVQSNNGNSAASRPFQPIEFWKLCNDGTNIKTYWSIDGGGHWVAVYSEVATSFLTNANNIFVGGYMNSSPVDVALISYATTNSCP